MATAKKGISPTFINWVQLILRLGEVRFSAMGWGSELDSLPLRALCAACRALPSIRFHLSAPTSGLPTSTTASKLTHSLYAWRPRPLAHPRRCSSSSWRRRRRAWCTSAAPAPSARALAGGRAGGRGYLPSVGSAAPHRHACILLCAAGPPSPMQPGGRAYMPVCAIERRRGRWATPAPPAGSPLGAQRPVRVTRRFSARPSPPTNSARRPLNTCMRHAHHQTHHAAGTPPAPRSASRSRWPASRSRRSTSLAPSRSGYGGALVLSLLRCCVVAGSLDFLLARPNM